DPGGQHRMRASCHRRHHGVDPLRIDIEGHHHVDEVEAGLQTTSHEQIGLLVHTGIDRTARNARPIGSTEKLGQLLTALPPRPYDAQSCLTRLRSHRLAVKHNRVVAYRVRYAESDPFLPPLASCTFTHSPRGAPVSAGWRSHPTAS